MSFLNDLTSGIEKVGGSGLGLLEKYKSIKNDNRALEIDKITAQNQTIAQNAALQAQENEFAKQITIQKAVKMIAIGGSLATILAFVIQLVRR